MAEVIEITPIETENVTRYGSFNPLTQCFDEKSDMVTLANMKDLEVAPYHSDKNELTQLDSFLGMVDTDNVQISSISVKDKAEAEDAEDAAEAEEKMK